MSQRGRRCKYRISGGLNAYLIVLIRSVLCLDGHSVLGETLPNDIYCLNQYVFGADGLLLY